MSTNDKPNQPVRTSPRGSFDWPKLTTPDTKYKTEGEFSVNLITSAEAPEAKKLLAQIEAEEQKTLAEAKKGAKNPAEAKKWEVKNHPYWLVYDEDGNETGEIAFKFKATASGVSKKTGKPWTRKIAIFDARGVALKNPPAIGSGTIGKVSYKFQPYAQTTQTGAGVKLALEGAQIINLKVWGERDAASHGFGAEDDEGGYSANDDATNDFADEAVDDTGDYDQDQSDF